VPRATRGRDPQAGEAGAQRAQARRARSEPQASEAGARETGERSGEVGRGRRKLEAALAAFDLAPRVRGARCLDVGAAVGGFTQALLAADAASVAAVDAGRGQLHPSLRADPRVESHERTDLRTLSLAALAGPFDFFCVDVSFAAARSFLRPLAFRLREGAHGVVLVKPQFELPAPRRKAAKDDPAAQAQRRARALERFAERAKKLGFALEAWRDSPVPGRAGTVEVLAHLRFDGPAPAARREGGAEPRPRAPAEAPLPSGPQAWFAVCAPGGEASVARELAALAGVSEVRAEAGGASFRGDLEAGLSANLWLRGATRVLLRVGELRAREFAQLRRRAARLPFAAWLREGTRVHVHVTQRGSRLYHTGAIAENVALALREAAGAELAGAPAEQAGGAGAQRAQARRARSEPKASEAGARREYERRRAPAEQTVFVRGERDRFTFSLDASGERLDRRGWRLERGAAAVRETLAALVLDLAGWRPEEALVDPACGSGTLAVEAALWALDAAPGLGRGFACEGWRGVDPAVVARLREEARGRRREVPPAAIVAADRSAAALDRARRNALRAGCAGAIRFEHAALEALAPPAGHGLVVLDPPYGRRTGSPQRARREVEAWIAVLRQRWRGWRVALLTPDARLASRLHLRTEAQHRLPHGGLRVQLLLFRA
jgi:putative N6-adenine-specific DNA methylase